MKVTLTADLHGALPEIDPCDLLIIAGDICPVNNHDLFYQADWLDRHFREWLENVPAKRVIGIAGNHDFVFDRNNGELVPFKLPWEYLLDEETEVDGLRIWGTPWVPNLKRWAFHGGMDNYCDDHFEDIPEGIDVLISHGPMNGYSDIVPGAGHVGDLHMCEVVRRVKPKLFVCGHIHEGYGHYRHPDVELGIYNVAHMNGFYDPINEPVEIEL